jgi:hypothetical protein
MSETSLNSILNPMVRQQEITTHHSSVSYPSTEGQVSRCSLRKGFVVKVGKF